MKSKTLPDLITFTACCWPAASLSRTELAEVRSGIDPHVSAGMLLTSCQRLEAYSLAPCACPAPQRLQGIDALAHLAEVAAGLHSVVLGEEQILGQVRSALLAAPAGVQRLGEVALAAARDFRRRTAFSSHSGHLLDRALRVAAVEPAGRLLVVGAGHIGRLVALRGIALGFGEVIVASRRKPDARWFEEAPLGHASLDRVTTLDPVDVAVGCLGSSAAELDPRHDLPAVTRLIVDLGTPRNFADGAAVPVVTIATLLAESQSRRHGDERRAALRAELRATLERRLAMAATDSGTAVGALRLEVERVRQQEMDRIVRLHPEIPPETLDTITRSLVNQLFHAPSERLKALDEPGFGEQVAALFAQPPAPAT